MGRIDKENDSPTAGRHPEKCRNGISFDGTYLCRLACLPCAALEKCALDEINEMAELTNRIMQRKRPSAKKKE